jgi:type II secretory pathway component GspD/PulD (secretin)
MLIKRFPAYTLEISEDYFYVKKMEVKPERPGRQATGGGFDIERDGDLYSVQIDKAQFSEILKSLFSKADMEYSLLMKRDMNIMNIRYMDKKFDRILRLLLEHASSDYKRVGDIYYIFEIAQTDVLKKLNSTVRLPLRYIPVQDLTKLFPPELAASKLYKIDTETNAVILSGSVEEIGPVQAFIEQIDKPSEDRHYFRFDLHYLNAKDIKSILPSSFKHHTPILIPHTNSFVMLLSPEKKEILDEYLRIVDRSREVEYVQLKYIKSEYLLKNMPPSISKDDIIETGDPSAVFVRGSPDKLETFFSELALIDQPIPQIRYDLLVILLTEGETFALNQNLSDNVFTIQQPPKTSQGAVLASLGKIASLNFDIISNFGLQFAVELNAGLSEDRAKVLADTTLNGISGEKISFRNTNTFRYREFEINPNTGELAPTGVVREIVSGLIIEINGWVSGDGMITMEVEAEISRLGTEADLDETREPPTFEKIVKTHVRSPSGEPIAIGGLITEDKTTTVQKVPVLGSIPLLGYFFQSEKDEISRSEFVIYILPSAEYLYTDQESIDRRIEELYTEYFQ